MPDVVFLHGSGMVVKGFLAKYLFLGFSKVWHDFRGGKFSHFIFFDPLILLACRLGTDVEVVSFPIFQQYRHIDMAYKADIEQNPAIPGNAGHPLDRSSFMPLIPSQFPELQGVCRFPKAHRQRPNSTGLAF